MTGKLPSRRRAIGRRMRETVALMTDTLIPPIDETKAEIDRLSLRTQLFIDGAFRDAQGGGRFVTENPATGRPITEVAQGGPADVDAAVAAARRAADDGRWSRLNPGDRKRILVRWADLIEANGRELGIIETHRRRQADHRHGRPRHARDRGLHPLARRGHRQALRPGRPVARGHGRHDHPRAGRRRRRRDPVELPGPDGRLEARAGARDRQHGRHQARVDDVAEPAPDRGAGRRGRASPTASLNVVTGPGDTVGEAIGRHPDIDCLAFTGSTEVGRRFLHYSAETNLKRVLLELGGKSPQLVFADARTSPRSPPTSRSRSSGTWARTARPGRG